MAEPLTHRGCGDQPDANAYLRAAIETVTSSPDLEAMARGVVKLVAEATSCQACVLYLLDDDHLLIRAASPEDAEPEGDLFQTVIGKDSGGHGARAGQLLFIPDRVLGGPGSSRRSGTSGPRRCLTSVPICSRSGVVGALTVHARDANPFSSSDIDLVEGVAALVGQAVGNLRLEEAADTTRALLLDLCRLIERLTGCSSTEEILGLVPAHCRTLLGGDRCEIFLLDDRQRLVLRAADPPRAPGRPIDARRLWLELVTERRRVASTSPEAGRAADAGALAEILWGPGIAGATLFAPLRVRGASLGVLAAVVAQPAPEARRSLATVASVTAFALKERETLDRLQEASAARDLFEALSDGLEAPEAMATRAAALGIDVEAPHIVLHASLSPPRSRGRGPAPTVAAATPCPRAAEEVEGKLLAALPGVVLHRRPGSVRAIVRVGPLPLFDVLKRVRGIHSDITASGVATCSIGLSNLCHDLHDLRQGLGQAASAAEIGALVHGAPGVYTPEDLGPYRYLLLCRGMVDERQQRLEALARYDQERGAKLFETLESWLDNKGNIVATSRALGVHQNTLRQRLARMEGILGFDLDGEDWLSMAMALKLVKLRLLHGAAREEQEEDRPACDPTGHRASRERALRSEPTDRIAWR